ncbi:hypothetical protein PVAP13_1KG185100 [Panicum virgatum]|uniref:Uncharacterized protein n=1 Tax=Panicum virgatum TaxID=38727 RepID=A0A8T0XH73_PANVG|nr:hypothetical protein PVAP13_1KG185100 [Panicum virgatum]
MYPSSILHWIIDESSPEKLLARLEQYRTLIITSA